MTDFKELVLECEKESLIIQKHEDDNFQFVYFFEDNNCTIIKAKLDQKQCRNISDFFKECLI
jgi:hypothetical protein